MLYLEKGHGVVPRAVGEMTLRGETHRLLTGLTHIPGMLRERERNSSSGLEWENQENSGAMF